MPFIVKQNRKKETIIGRDGQPVMQLVGRVITCSKCHQEGGTLVRKGLGQYVHDTCR
jgi:hypothetical protein